MESYSEIAEILKDKDPILKKVIENVESDLSPSLSLDIYQDLLNSICSQQLSIKAAATIWERFLDLFPDRYPAAKELIAIEEEQLRASGLSRSKAKYMKNVAEYSLNNDMSFEALSTKSDETIIKELSSIVGVGKWTVQMILMFPMDRRNVFPVDDLGIQTKMKYWYQLDLDKKELKKKLVEISENWDPYKSIASKYIWHSHIEK